MCREKNISNETGDITTRNQNEKDFVGRKKKERQGRREKQRCECTHGHWTTVTLEIYLN